MHQFASSFIVYTDKQIYISLLLHLLYLENCILLFYQLQHDDKKTISFIITIFVSSVDILINIFYIKSYEEYT